MAVYSSLEHPRIVSIPFLRGVCDATGCLLRVYLEGWVYLKHSDGIGLFWIVVIPKRRGYARFFEMLCQLGRCRG